MTTPLPRPLAADGTVSNDPASRTLAVKPAADAPGYTKLLWREGHRALLEDENRRVPRLPAVWASAPGGYRIASGSPGKGVSLEFRFPVGDPRYRELV